jgi:hypothetical protein
MQAIACASMAVDDRTQKQAHQLDSAAPAKDGSPTDLLTAAWAAADAMFKKGSTGDQQVMVAFGLGWQMAEVYRPDRRRGWRPAAQDDLPGISRLTAVELEKMGLFQLQSGIAKLRASICDAGLDVPNAERFAEMVSRVGDGNARREAVREFHVELLATLTAADFRLGKAYGLGRALADTTRLPPDWRAELQTYRVSTLAGWVRELASVMAPHAAHPVAQSLEAWSGWAQTQRGDGGETRRKLGAQGRLWRSLLSGEKQATDMLETSDYVRAGEGMVKANGALMRKVLWHYRTLVLFVIALLGLGVWLIVGPGNKIAAGFGGLSIFASIGLSWKGIGTSLGKAGVHVEEPLWQAALDQVIYERITPDEIVKSQRGQKPSPDEPSLVAETQEPKDHDNPASSGTAHTTPSPGVTGSSA